VSRAGLVFFFALAVALAAAQGRSATHGLIDGDEARFSPAPLPRPGDVEPAEEKKPKPGEELVLTCPAKVFEGEPFLVRVSCKKPLREAMIYWLGKEVAPSIRIAKARHVAVALLGTDVLTIRPGKRELVVVASVEGRRRTLIREIFVAGQHFPEQALSVPKVMAAPPSKVLARIESERKAVRQVLEAMTPHRFWSLPLARPVEGEITTRYGTRRLLNGQPKAQHRGVDFQADEGAQVVAAADGLVVYLADHYFTGRSVYLDHGNGVVSMYFHLSTQLVGTGQAVRRGDPVGLAGASGRSTGPHLHFGLAVQGFLVDPEPLFRDNPNFSVTE
jgi:murein DD-endopeptidase MepM/ murein hydrolase activator NlpD